MSDNKDENNVFETVEGEDGSPKRRVSKDIIRKYTMVDEDKLAASKEDENNVFETVEGEDGSLKRRVSKDIIRKYAMVDEDKLAARKEDENNGKPRAR